MTNWKQIEDTYEAVTYARLPVVFMRGDGCFLYDEQGNRYVDLYGGHCVSGIGHSPKRVLDAILRQGEELLFYSNIIYHPARARAAKRLIELSPNGFDKVFFCNTGTEANENALKIAWLSTGKTHIVSTRGGWHGRTLGSLSVTWSDKMRSPVKFALPDVSFVPFGDASSLNDVLNKRTDVAAFILEPIQSISGINTASAEYFRKIRDICDSHGVLLIFDEIQTGVGRTGLFSYSEWLGMRPDIITLAKSLASGYPVGAVLMPDRIASVLKVGDLGSTFAGGMMAMAACEATLNEIIDLDCMSNAREVFNVLSQAFAGSPVNVKGAGCLIGLELEIEAKPVVQHLLKTGWITGTSDHPNVIRLMPPLNVPIELIQQFSEVLKHAIQK